jgi:HEAT repeat protein
MRSTKLLCIGLFAAGVFALMLPAAVEAAGKAEEAKKHIETIKTSKDVKKKTEAFEELGKLGQIMKTLAEPAVPDMLKSLEDKDPAIRKAAAECLGKCDPDPKEALPALLKLVKDDKDESVKIGAIRGLASMTDKAAEKDVMTTLREIVKENKGDQKSKIGREAQNALRSIQPKKK